MKSSFKITLTGIEGRVIPDSKIREVTIIAMNYKDVAEITHTKKEGMIPVMAILETFEFDFNDMSTMLEFAQKLKNL